MEFPEHRITYYASPTPEISGLEKAILFVSASWALQSKKQLANLFKALEEVDSRAGDVSLLIADTDKLNYEHVNRMLDEKCFCAHSHRNHLGGNGEIIFVKNGKVVDVVAYRSVSVDVLQQMILRLSVDEAS